MDVSDHQNLEAEESVLGAMMLSARAIDECEEILGPKGTAFYRLGHQIIYRAILALRSEQKPTDTISVHSFLTAHSMMAEAGGETRLREIAAIVPSTSNAAHYARIVLEHAQLREIVVAAQEFLALTGPGREGRSVDELHDQMERVLATARDAHAPSEVDEHTAWEMAEFLDHRMKNPQTDAEGIRSPFRKVPRLQGGRLYVLAGYQADGKTALVPDFIRCAIEDGKRVGFATYEMGWKDVAVRMAASLGAPAKQMETGRVSDVDMQKATAAIARLATMNLKVQYDPKPTVAALSRWQRRNRFDLLIVDHLHQFPIEDPRYERQFLERIIREIQGLAIAEDVPILLLAQLSRVGDPKKPYPRPTMASLRGTAMIEALAWCVWFVWRERDKKNLPTSTAEFITAKNRSGRTGSFGLVFHDRMVRFSESTEEDLPA